MGFLSQNSERQVIFSIIMPIYNSQEYLSKSIQSVINQTYQNWELICVDDGSVDNSLELCHKFAAKDARIKVFTKINEGVSSARNFGLKQATGDRIVFLDADDWFSEDILEIFSKYDLNTDLIIANHVEVFSNKSEKASLITETNVATFYERKELVRFCISESQWREDSWYGYLRPVWGKCFSKNLIEQYNLVFLPSLKIGEDMVFLLTYLLKVESVRFTNDYVYYYNRANETSTMNNRNWEGPSQGLIYYNAVKNIVEDRFDEETLSDLWLETAESDWRSILYSNLSLWKKYLELKKLFQSKLYQKYSKKIVYKSAGKKKKLYLTAIKYNSPLILLLLFVLKEQSRKGDN